MIGLRDTDGLASEVVSATPWEKRLGEILGRWCDGFNAVRPLFTPTGDGVIGGREMQLVIRGIGEAKGCTEDYLFDFRKVISFISREITLLPGDIVTLGSSGNDLTIPSDIELSSDTKIIASIEGAGEFSTRIIDSPAKGQP